MYLYNNNALQDAVLTEAEDAAYLLNEVREKMLKKIRFIEKNTKINREEVRNLYVS